MLDAFGGSESLTFLNKLCTHFDGFDYVLARYIRQRISIVTYYMSGVLIRFQLNRVILLHQLPRYNIRSVGLDPCTNLHCIRDAGAQGALIPKYL